MEVFSTVTDMQAQMPRQVRNDAPGVMQRAMWCCLLVLCSSTPASSLTVCVVHDPPFTICPSATFQGFVKSDTAISGFDVDMLRYMLTDAGFSWDAAAGNSAVQYRKYNWRCGPELTKSSVEAAMNYGSMSTGPWPTTSQAPPAPPPSASMSSGSSPLPYSCDIGIGHFTITSLTAKAGAMYVPYYATGAAIMLPTTTVSVDSWAFMRPFHWSLWVGFLCFAFVVPASVFFVERLNADGVFPLHMQGLHEWRLAQYQTFLAIFNLQVYEVLSAAAQINIVAFCFMILIVVQTYNAQLGALYVSSQGVTAVQSMADLHDSNVGVYPEYADILQQRYPKAKMVAYTPANAAASFTQAVAALEAGDVVAFVHDASLLTNGLAALPDPCKYKLIATPLAYQFLYGILFNAGWSADQVINELYLGLIHAQEAFVDIRLQDQYLGTAPACTAPDTSTTLSGVTFSQMSGLFLVVGVVTAATLLSGFLTMVYRVYQAMHDDEDGSTVAGQVSVGGSERGSIRATKSLSRALSKVFVKEQPMGGAGTNSVGRQSSVHGEPYSRSASMSMKSVHK